MHQHLDEETEYYENSFGIFKQIILIDLFYTTTSNGKRYYNMMERVLAFKSEDLGQSPLNIALWTTHLTNLIVSCF